MRDSAQLGGIFKGEQFLLSFDWGTKGVTCDQANMPTDGQVSYGDLWGDAAKGKSALGQNSVIVGTGLYLDAIGAVPSNRMLDVYKSEDNARRVWGEITKWVLERKENLGDFWNNATEATAALKDAGSIIGQTWDTTGLLLNRENPDFLYRAARVAPLQAETTTRWQNLAKSRATRQILLLTALICPSDHPDRRGQISLPAAKSDTRRCRPGFVNRA